MKLKDIIKEKEILAKSKHLETDSISYLIKNYFFQSQTDYYLALNKEFNKTKTLDKLINRYLIDNIPPQYILGYTYFLDNKILVNKNVLIPRRETEEVALKAIDIINSLSDKTKVLDLCTGSGCIAIAIKKMTNAIVSASDISKKALLISKKNAIINNVNIDFIYSDMFKNITDKYDVIISNPPYLSLLDCLHASNMVTSKEPINALYAKDNGLFFYKIIVDNASRYLTGEKYLVLEMGDNQCDGVINYVKEKKENIKIDLYQDMQGKNRILVLKY